MRDQEKQREAKRRWKKRNVEAVRASKRASEKRRYKRYRAKHPARALLTEEEKVERRHAYQAEWKASNRDKRRAHSRIAHEKERHGLDAQPCEVCGNRPTDGHHDDYDQPLDVRWLCRKHHVELHVGLLHGK